MYGSALVPTLFVTPQTRGIVEITELLDRATDAWNRYDRDAYVAIHTEDYEIVTRDLAAKGQ
jgi:hypothetical protein